MSAFLADDTTPTPVNIRTSLGMAAAATTVTAELSKDASAKSLGFIDGVVGSVTALDTTTGGTATAALSNVASAWLLGATAGEQNVGPTDRRRLTFRTEIADNLCVANCSWPGKL